MHVSKELAAIWQKCIEPAPLAQGISHACKDYVDPTTAIVMQHFTA